jgi:hypothetical protein
MAGLAFIGIGCCNSSGSAGFAVAFGKDAGTMPPCYTPLCSSERGRNVAKSRGEFENWGTNASHD